MRRKNKLILLLLICTLLPATAHAGWRKTALKILTGGKTAATSAVEEQLPAQTAAVRSATTQATVTAMPRSVNPAALAPLHLQLPPMPTINNLSVAHQAVARQVEQLSRAGQLPTGMPPTVAAASVVEQNLEKSLSDPSFKATQHMLRFPPVKYGAEENSLQPEIFDYSTHNLSERLRRMMTSQAQQQQQLIQTIADNHNAAYTHFVTEVAPVIREQVNELRPQFEQLSNYWAEHQPDNPALWAAEQIPADIDNLLIGEVHVHSVPKGIIPMVEALTKKMNGREIIFLTEPLPLGHVLDVKRDIPIIDAKFPGEKQFWNDKARYYDLWKELDKRNITVIGLEPTFVGGTLEDKTIETDCYLRPVSDTTPRDVWTSLEGFRVRNKYWLEEIQKQRDAHPDALFIIYAGAHHTSYLYPFSLARELTGKNFVIEATPKQYQDDLDNLILPTQMPDCLSVTGTGLAPITGFDLRIKVERDQLDYF